MWNVKCTSTRYSISQFYTTCFIKHVNTYNITVQTYFQTISVTKREHLQFTPLTACAHWMFKKRWEIKKNTLQKGKYWNWNKSINNIDTITQTRTR